MLLPVMLLALATSQTVRIAPTETVWVYQHAPAPANTPFLYAWGAEGRSLPEDGEDGSQYSFSFLKFDLSKIDISAAAGPLRLTSAKLIFKNVPDPGFTVQTSAKTPIEARALTGDFDVATWTFDQSVTIHPKVGKAALFGTGSPTAIKAGEPVTITVDLLANPGIFSKAFADAFNSATHKLTLSIAAAIDPSVDGRSSVYKLYGIGEAQQDLRPVLDLKFER